MKPGEPCSNGTNPDWIFRHTSLTDRTLEYRRTLINISLPYLSFMGNAIACTA
jgi:hypothetical protein